LVYDIRIEEEKEHRTFVADLGRNKQECLIAKGGAAGRGNKNHPTTTGDQRLGKEGEMKIIYLELKTLADIGLVGFPNIGKSTFLAASTRALPKIANY
jgi:GTP-binding protein